MDFTTTHTTCPYCACGCGLLLEVLDGRIVATLPSKTNATNKGKLCIKGWNVHEFVQHPTRLQKPLFRQNGSFQEISWDEALGQAAAEIGRIRDTYGPDSLGFFTPRALYQRGELSFAEAGPGGHRHQQCGSLRASLTAPTVAGLALAFGSGAMTNSFDELEEADCIFAIGSNTTREVSLADDLLRPLEQAGILVPRPQERIEADIERFFVMARDGTAIACAAFTPYPAESSGELACVAVHPDYRNQRRGDKLLTHIEALARRQGLKHLFVLTTQTAHWFRERGFEPGGLIDLPAEKQALYNYRRNSQIYVKEL